MKKVIPILFFLSAISCTLETAAQSNTMKDSASADLPYYQIPDYPETYTAGTVAARMADGLGFRYYWATEGLQPEDLQFRPGETARTSEETLAHIYGLSQVIVNACRRQPNMASAGDEELPFEELRRKTLENFKEASDILRASESLSEFPVVFQRGENRSEYPFWNLINGPIADALWHVGQVVSFRRSSGNPLNPKVSMFNGKLRE